MNVLSLFDGMSCGQIVLKELGIKVSKYYASEIDKFAIRQTQHNFPDTVQLVSVEDWKTWDIDYKSINLILAGSPCQGFSFAGKQLAFDDPRSRLFFVFIDILNHIRRLNPDVKFLLENVDMKRSHMKVITDYCGVYPVNINSNLVSAQNCNRWYWTNVKTKEHPVFGDLIADIPQPTDEGILLRDILEKDVDERYFLSNKIIETLSNRPVGYNFNVVDDNEKSGCIRKDVAKMGTTDTYICVAMRGRNPENPSSRVSGLPTEQRLEPNVLGVTNCLTSVSKDNLILQLNTSTESGGKQPYQQNRVYSDSRIRRLTPIECARLQTIPDWYEWVVSDTQIYKMCGNGWTVKVIMWILGFLKE